ncbi:hypothetical protein CFC21_076344 [Triticum aestivum]|uniref:Putative zinc-finger domain-containing protein n=2 Tax=Triticum aestivum TaxID=4565 RepID=A0A9R1HU45_WHEAT|nr:uncharacterized protein LOC123119721 [Triticum aestivum]KAF7070906.1 hypothetical protein CFC21_076344 [Triticum aestivum]
MSGPRPAAAPNPSSASPSPPPPPAPAAAVARVAARVREEGEVSSGPSDDEALQSQLLALSNAGKYVQAAAQVTSATFPGKGGSSLSLSNILPQKTVAPSYKKTLRVNQGQFKLGTSRNLAWLKPVPSDNLVISFSDDDIETDSGMSKQVGGKGSKANTQVTHKPGMSMQTRLMREEAPQQKIRAANIGSTKWSANPHTLRNSAAGRGSGATFSRREPPIRQVTPLKSSQKDGTGMGVKSADDKLESLRHKIAARENELKVQKRPISPGFVKEADCSTDQTRPPLEKIGFEASNSGRHAHLDGPFGHDGRPVKRLKPNQQCFDNQVGGDLVTLVTPGSSLGNDNVQSSERRDHIENGITMNCKGNETEHAITTESSDQMHIGGTAMNLLSSKSHHMVLQDGGNHAMVECHSKLAGPPFTSEQPMAEDTSALVPVTSVPAGANVDRSSIHVKDHIFSNQDWQQVKPVGTSTVSNERLHLQPGMENADLLNRSGQVGTRGQNTTLLSLLEMEELQDRELEVAQEHRRKCEVEEREALRAYRKAQKALIEANERCAILRGKREVCSAQVHGLIAENSSLAQCSNIQNAGRGFVMPSLLNSQFHADLQMPEIRGGRSSSPYQDEPPQQPVDKHEARSRHCDELAAGIADPKFASTVHDNSEPSHYREEDLLFSSKRARSECTSNLENEETIHAYLEENREPSGDNGQDYELLEASLRSRLVQKFARNPHLNNSGEVTEEHAEVTEQGKQPANVELQLQDADEIMTNPEGTAELANDGADCVEKMSGLSNSSNALSMGNCDPEDNISSLGELCAPSSVNSLIFPSSAPLNAAKHIKWVVHGFCINDSITSNVASDATVSDQYMIQDRVEENLKMVSTATKDKDMVHSGIDPFWPFCMFELRGKCNDEECQWQHIENHAWRKSNDTKHAMSSVSGRSPYDLFQHILPVPTYRVGSNLIRADLNLMQSVLASSIWQYWQRGFCASFPLPLSVQRVLPSDAPFLQAGDGSIADFDRNRQLSNLRMLDGRKNKIVQGSVDVELFLEAALGLYCGKVNKPDRLKALLLLARSIEADPSTVILWVFYLHIYYQKDEGLGKDDMFSHAVQHNVYSYELWLMYINSRLRFDDRLDAYNDALSMLCQMPADTDNELKDRSAFILDIFLQMIYFLCMSGNVDKAISRIYGILPAATADCSGEKLLSDAISCLTVSDRCIFWISCLYISIYRKLPEEICDQLEFPKDIPRMLVWHPIELRVDNRRQVTELLKHVADKMSLDINETVKNGDPSYLKLSQFLAVNHISCLAALEGLQSSVGMLMKYMKEYPMCPNILLFAARICQKYGTCPGLKGFDELLMDWPKEVQGVQCLWNQYAEHALADNIELAEKILARWFEEYGKNGNLHSSAAVCMAEVGNEVSEQPQEVCSGPSASEDQVYWLLNLSLYRMLENNLQEAQVAVNKALKLARGESYEHCLREHAAINMLERPSCTDTQARATLNLMSGYLADLRNLPVKELLSRRFIQNVKKHKLRQLIDDTIGPASADSSVINSTLEVCYGQSLLPEKIGGVKYLVDFVESVMEVLPANYRLALAVGTFVVKHYTGSDPTSMSTRFWASSVLINAIFRAVPVAPESVWIEGANLLEKLQAAETVKRFHQQATSVYPFSFKLWHAYLTACKASGSNTDSITEAARQRGIELNVMPP